MRLLRSFLVILSSLILDTFLKKTKLKGLQNLIKIIRIWRINYGSYDP